MTACFTSTSLAKVQARCLRGAGQKAVNQWFQNGDSRDGFIAPSQINVADPLEGGAAIANPFCINRLIFITEE